MNFDFTSDDSFGAYLRAHPINNQDPQKGRIGSAFPGQAAPERTEDDVRKDVNRGHELLGTSPKIWSESPSGSRYRSHADAEFIGYHANQKKHR